MDSPSACQKGHLILKAKCPYCKELKKAWYHYLEQTGFEDIEAGDLLKGQKNPLGDKIESLAENQTAFRSRLQYNLWVTRMVDQGSFESTVDKIIWECHADGMSRRLIGPLIDLEHSYVSIKLKKIEAYLREQCAGVSAVSVQRTVKTTSR